ncbi:MAG TPA: cytochrome c biogenesis protein ResB, partial [Verrucomicrobiae bacterium]|nr:cytochrome c biogenesis protein ResB [Verrucomicrobiae bacterium]
MRLLHLLKSRKSAVYLLTIITAVLVIGSFLPNPAYVTQAEAENIKNSQFLSFLAKFTPLELSKTWFFYALFSVLSLSIIVCTVDRLRYRLQIPKRAKTITRAGYQGSVEDAYLTLSHNLMREKWLVRSGEDASELFAEKGHLGFWGSIAFHVSILLMVLGGVLTASESLLAGIVVTEGQTLPVSSQTIIDKARMPRFGNGNTGLTIRLDTFRPELSNGTAVKYTAS